MADTILTPTGLVQIEVGASRGTWGGKYNVMVATVNSLFDNVSGAAALKIANGGTGATSAAGALAALGAQPLDADLTAIAALTTTSIGRSLLAATDAAALRSILGLGTMATQNANGVSITGGSATGLTSVSANDVTELN